MAGTDALRTAVLLREARRMLRAPLALLQDVQRERLSAAVSAAAATEPYRSLYAADALDAGRSVSELPIVDRSVLAAVPFEDRLSSRPRPLLRVGTSGTTGRPLSAGQSREEALFQRVVLARQLDAQGIPPRARTFVADVAGQLEDARSTLNGRVVRTRVPASPRSLADRIRTARAEVVVGWPSILMEVADAGEQLRVPWVVTFGEVLHPGSG